MNEELIKQHVLVTKVDSGRFGDHISFYVLNDLVGNSGEDVGKQFTSLGYFSGPKVGDELIITRDPSENPMWSYGILSSDTDIRIETEILKRLRQAVLSAKIQLKKRWRARLGDLRRQMDKGGNQ